MEEISLYRKYRPHNFENLVGQDHIKTTLMNAFKANRVAHAYLFTGPRGTGKTSSARLVAKALNCGKLGDGYEPCNSCELCNDINDGRLIDLVEIDAASNRGIDEVRDLKEKINFSPTRAKYKVYIIDEVHMMTKEAFNALLKTLEEPPAHAYFILATTEAHKIPETIISRCQRFDFKRITTATLTSRLSFIAEKEGIVAEEKALNAISKYVDGGLRDAIGLVEQLTVDGGLSFERVQEILGLSDSSLLGKFYEAILNGDTKEALNSINELHFQGSDLKQFTHELIELLREKMLESVAQDKSEMVARFIRIIEILQTAQQKLDFSIPQLALEIAVMEITGNFQRAAVSKAEVKVEVKKAEPAQVEAKKPEVLVVRKHQPIEEVVVGELSLESLKKNWPRVGERIKTPALRLSLRHGVPIALEGYAMTLEFATNFHRDKVMESGHKLELEKTVEAVFGHALKIVATVKSLSIKPVVEEKADGMVDEALEIFGGEVVG